MKNFIDIYNTDESLNSKDSNNIPSNDLPKIIKHALLHKSDNFAQYNNALNNKNIIIFFEENSTRTRLSLEIAINQLGGNAIILDSKQSQAKNGESFADTAKMFNLYADMVIIRTNDHNKCNILANNCNIPIINALSDKSHPLQIMASILTIYEKLGDIENKKLTWMGDVNNVLYSYIKASKIFNYHLLILTNNKLVDNNLLNQINDNDDIDISEDINLVKDSDLIATDTWLSMCQKNNNKNDSNKFELLKKFQVNKNIYDLASKSLFTHCLPAYRDMEITDFIINCDRSMIFEEANNKLHIHKSIILYLFNLIT